LLHIENAAVLVQRGAVKFAVWEEGRLIPLVWSPG